MQIRIRQSGEIIGEDEFRQRNPNSMGAQAPVLTEEILNSHECDVLYQGAQPSGDRYQFPVGIGVEQQSNGKWYTKYVLGPVFRDIPATDDQPAKSVADQEAAYRADVDASCAKAVRDNRNRRLSDCDWTQIADSTANKAAWAVYRQALRDISGQSGFPWDIEWPTEP